MAAKPFIVTITGLSGSVESGGLLYSFVRSTSTPRPLYTDVGLGTPATNPVVADALGLITVYFNDALEYTWRAKTADDSTTLWEADVVSGVLALTYINPDYSEHPIIEASWVPALGAALGDGWATVFGLPASSVLDNLSGIRFVATYAALTALTSATGLSDNAIYCTYGRAAEEDGGFGFWRYDSGSSATANGGTVLAIDGGGAGRFFRLFEDAILPKWFAIAADGATDDTSGVSAWLAAAATAGKWADGEGRTIAVSASLDASSYSGLKLRDVTLKALTPNTSTRKVFYASGNDNIQLVRVKILRNGDGSSGAITTSAGIWLDQCDRPQVIDCEVSGNNEGNGIVIWQCPQAKIVRPYIHDIAYVHVAQSDDVIQGIWMVLSDDFLIDNPVIRKFGRTDQTSNARDRFNRGISTSGCRGGVINNPQLYRLDQAIDITGDGHNTNIVVNGGSIRHCYSHAVKFAVSAVGCKAIGVQAEAIGFIAFTVGGYTAGALNLTQDCEFIGCTARNTGCAKQQTAANVKGFTAERGTGATSPYTAWPKNIQFKECLAISDVGAAAVTFASTTLLTVSSAAPIKAALGVRVQFTTSGSLPTGLSLATDYWLVPIRATSTVAVATSYINALNAYEAQEAGLSYSAYVVSTLAGGSGTHTMTLFQDMYDGFFNNVAIADADTTMLNRAVNCQSFGQTNKRFNGIQTGVPIWASFSARSAGDINNVTGDGTTYDVIWDTEISDPSGGFSTSTGIWTAPETGQYLLTANITLSGMAAGNDRVFLSITTSNRNYQQDYGDIPADANTRVGCAISALVDMEEGDTAYVQIFVSGGTKVVDIKGGSLSTFTGALIGG